MYYNYNKYLQLFLYVASKHSVLHDMLAGNWCLEPRILKGELRLKRKKKNGFQINTHLLKYLVILIQ